jgi:cystathionine beta-lyase/cystathionine gamma-synthase
VSDRDPRAGARERGFATRAIHDADVPVAGIAEEPVSASLWPSSDYLYEGLEHYADVINERRPGYVYGRYGGPTHTALHRVLASLEGADTAWAFASGMAAIHTTLTSILQAGDHVVAGRALYGGTFSLLTGVFPRYGIRSSLVEPEAAAVEEAIRPETRAVLVETLANPTFRVADVAGIASACRRAGVTLVVDNSVATPCLLRPLELPGVTFVLHSTTKYVNGHADVIGGVVAGSRDGVDGIRRLALEQGTTAGAFEAWLTIRGVQTLPVRFTRQCATAMTLARFLARHPKVADVGYSGLPTHPDHDRAETLFAGRGFGAMLAVTLEGGYEAAEHACDSLRLARVGSSFGSLRTEVCHPGTTSHRQLSPEARAAAGIGDGLIRVAVGGEDPDDLVEDFGQALEKA